MMTSRNEQILRATIDGTDYGKPPQSSIEELLIELKDVIEAGGGGGSGDASPLTTQQMQNLLNLL